MMKKFNTKHFKTSDLIKIKSALPVDCPPLSVGDWCVMNSGSSSLLVVNTHTNCVTVAIKGGEEHTLPRACVRRVAVKF